jgi:predicted small integral membrane protein
MLLPSTQAAARWAKILLLAAIALFFTLVAFNNITDFDTNYQFVRHILAMDTTFADSHTTWRAIRSPAIHLAFYIGIILWETLSALLGWAGAIALFRARLASPAAFAAARRTGTLALISGLLLWLLAFTTIGGEWFLMWQSRDWNGQQAAFRMFTTEALILILLLSPEADPSL